MKIPENYICTKRKNGWPSRWRKVGSVSLLITWCSIADCTSSEFELTFVGITFIMISERKSYDFKLKQRINVSLLCDRSLLSICKLRLFPALEYASTLKQLHEASSESCLLSQKPSIWTCFPKNRSSRLKIDWLETWSWIEWLINLDRSVIPWNVVTIVEDFPAVSEKSSRENGQFSNFSALRLISLPILKTI